MSCKECNGRADLIGYNLEKCIVCGNEQQVEFNTSTMQEIRRVWKRIVLDRL